MVNDIATLGPLAATPYPAMADRVACLRDRVECGAYKVDLPTLAAAMLGFGTRQIYDNRPASKI